MTTSSVAPGAKRTLVREEHLQDGSWRRYFSDNSSEVLTNAEREALKASYAAESEAAAAEALAMFEETEFITDDDDDFEILNNLTEGISIEVHGPEATVLSPQTLKSLQEIAQRLDKLQTLTVAQCDALADAINSYVATNFGTLPLFEIVRLAEDGKEETRELVYRLNAIEGMLFCELDVENPEKPLEKNLWVKERNLEILHRRLEHMSASGVDDGNFHDSDWWSELAGITPLVALTGNRICSLEHMETLHTAIAKGPARLRRPIPGTITPIAKLQFGEVEARSVWSLLEEARFNWNDEKSAGEVEKEVVHVWAALLSLQTEGVATLRSNEEYTTESLKDSTPEEVDEMNKELATTLYVVNHDALEEQLLAALREYKAQGFPLSELKQRNDSYNKPFLWERADMRPGFIAKQGLYFPQNFDFPEKTWLWGWSNEEVEENRGKVVALDIFASVIESAATEKELLEKLESNPELEWEFIGEVPPEGLQGKLTRRPEVLAAQEN